MIATLKIKEENEERQRRDNVVVHLPNPNLSIIQASQIKTEGKFLKFNCSFYRYFKQTII